MKFETIKGDLIELAKQGKFDVITHGCNCFCTMGAGIAVPMSKEFGCNRFPLEQRTEMVEYPDGAGDFEYFEEDTGNYGDINKLGQIDYETVPISLRLGHRIGGYSLPKPDDIIEVVVVNSYTQYSPGSALPGFNIPLDYQALALCMRKINYTFKGKHIGLPKIGAGLAGGDWERIETIIQSELKDCDVTIVEFNK